MAHPILRRTLFQLARFRVNLIAGFEHLPQEGPLIIASNHVSYLDPPILYSMLVPKLRQKIHFFSKESVVDGFGELLGERWMGMIPVRRNDPSASLDIAVKHLREGKIVGIFPEALRNISQELFKGKTGVARLALNTGAPVLPIGFEGPPGWTASEALKNFIRTKDEIRIRIGEPLSFEQFANASITGELLEEVTRTIMLRIGQLCNKRYPY